MEKLGESREDPRQGMVEWVIVLYYVTLSVRWEHKSLSVSPRSASIIMS